MMQVIFCTSHVHTYFIHTYPFISLFLVVMCCYLSLSLSFSDILRMAPKRKSTPAWNLLGSGSSSSNPSIPPLHIRFRDGKAQQDFLENFQKHGVLMLLCRTFLTLFYLRSFGLGAGNLFVRDPWGVSSCLCRSFTPIYTVSIPL